MTREPGDLPRHITSPAGCPVGRMFAVTDSLRADVRAAVCRLANHRLEAAVMSVTVATLGFPRIGPRRELKTALEGYWAGKTDQIALLAAAADLRCKA
jgi:hypothetical protein